jgi:F-type H+-transporting ATPase subunit epsilon
MADTIHLEIVTPTGVELSADVSELTAPSVDGEFGVLPGHRPLLAALRTGIVTYRQDREEYRVAVGAGFVQVSGDDALLLTDRFVRKDDVDPVRARLELKEADQDLERFPGAPDTPEYSAIVQRELWAAAQLELYGDPPPPTVRAVEHEFQLVSPDIYRERPEGAPLSEASVEQVESRSERSSR